MKEEIVKKMTEKMEEKVEEILTKKEEIIVIYDTLSTNKAFRRIYNEILGGYRNKLKQEEIRQNIEPKLRQLNQTQKSQDVQDALLKILFLFSEIRSDYVYFLRYTLLVVTLLLILLILQVILWSYFSAHLVSAVVQYCNSEYCLDVNVLEIRHLTFIVCFVLLCWVFSSEHNPLHVFNFGLKVPDDADEDIRHDMFIRQLDNFSEEALRQHIASNIHDQKIEYKKERSALKKRVRAILDQTCSHSDGLEQLSSLLMKADKEQLIKLHNRIKNTLPNVNTSEDPKVSAEIHRLKNGIVGKLSAPAQKQEVEKLRIFLDKIDDSETREMFEKKLTALVEKIH